VLAGRFLPVLDPVEEAVEAVGNGGELVSHVVSDSIITMWTAVAYRPNGPFP
jgi:hypothetical protein